MFANHLWTTTWGRGTFSVPYLVRDDREPLFLALGKQRVPLVDDEGIYTALLYGIDERKDILD